MSIVNSLPDELWLLIFTLSCVDGGFTGASISVVSRRFHVVSGLAKLHSVAISNDKSLQQICDILSDSPSACRTIRHLLVDVSHYKPELTSIDWINGDLQVSSLLSSLDRPI